MTISQIGIHYKRLLIIAGVSVSFLALVQLFSFLMDIPIENLTRDVIAVSGSYIYNGMLSQIGLLIWGAAAAISLFSWWRLSGTDDRKMRSFLLASGIFTLWLCLDDMFLLHEEFLPNIVGISEDLVIIAYLLILLGYLGGFFKTILKTEFIILIYALGFFSGSILLDKFVQSWSSIFEDGMKFLGLVGWGVYLIRQCYLILKANKLQLSP